MSSEKRKIAYIDGKPYEIGSKHTSILKFVKSYLGEKKVPTLCDDQLKLAQQYFFLNLLSFHCL